MESEVTRSTVSSRTFTKDNHLKSVLDKLNEQRVQHMFCDVILRVDKVEIYAHSSVLAAASPYFGTFLGRGQDYPRAFSQKTPQIIEIHIDGNEDNVGYADAVNIIVNYMYSGKLQLKSKFLIQTVEIAKIMQMETILKFCDQFTSFKTEVSMPMGASTQTKILQTSEKEIQTDLVNEESDHSSYTKITEPLALRRHMHVLVKKSTSRFTRQKLFSKGNRLPHKSFDKSTLKQKHSEKDTLDKSTPYDTDIIGIKRKASSSLKTISPKKLKDESDVYLEEFDSSHTLNDKNLALVCENLKKELEGQNIDESEKGRFPLRKTRGKKPLKFQDIEESDSDALVVDECKEEPSAVEESQFQKSKLLTCEECPYSSYSSYHFGRHQQAHERDGNKKMYKCDHCDFTTNKLKTLQDHKREHIHAHKICSFCDIDLESFDALQEHLSSHKPPLRYHCLFCSSKFKTRAQLNSHKPKHLDEKPFTCHICKAGFKWKHALKGHMATHSETKEHLCDVCGFATAHKSQLKAHKLIHTGDTFKCTFPNCQFQSIKKQSLKYHMLTHTQEKAHQCEICGQSFSLVKNLKRHALLHSNERPYKCTCTGCEYAASRYDKLKDHLLKIHGLGKVPGRKFRLSDYPKSLVPPVQTKFDEQDQNILQIDHIPKTDGEGNAITTKVFIQQPDGETIPVTLLASKFQIPFQLITSLEN